MREFSRPKVVVSRCLEFDHCRYNGDKISSPVAAKLKKYVDFLPVCPEMEIGLGTPRNPVRIILNKGDRRLVQPSSGKDITENMKTFCSSFLNTSENIDGFILKFRSPSCGLKDVKVYPSVGGQEVVENSSGYFGGGSSGKVSSSTCGG